MRYNLQHGYLDKWWIYCSDSHSDNHYKWLLPNGNWVNITVNDTDHEKILKENPKYYFNSRRWAISALKQYDPRYKLI